MIKRPEVRKRNQKLNDGHLEVRAQACSQFAANPANGYEKMAKFQFSNSMYKPVFFLQIPENDIVINTYNRGLTPSMFIKSRGHS